MINHRVRCEKICYDSRHAAQLACEHERRRFKDDSLDVYRCRRKHDKTAWHIGHPKPKNFSVCPWCGQAKSAKRKVCRPCYAWLVWVCWLRRKCE